MRIILRNIRRMFILASFNKRGQLFSLVLVPIVLFLCGVVIVLYVANLDDTQASLVSPSSVLEIRNELTIFELREVELIKSSFEGAEGEFNSDEFRRSFRSSFIDGVDGNKEMTEFIYGGLFFNDAEIREVDKNKNLLNDLIYSENLVYSEGDKISFGRVKIEKRSLLVADNESKIDFPVYFTFEFERKYSIDKNGEVAKV